MRITISGLVLLGVVAGTPGCTTAVSSTPEAAAPARGWIAADSAAAHAAAGSFLAAFDSLQWDRFRSYLAEDMTMFFPFPDVPARVDGRVAVEAVFRPFFEGQGPGVQGIRPRDLRVQMAGADVAVVTFHLGGTAPSHRSVVLQRTGGGWEVIHWHASPAPQRPAAREPGPTLPAAEIARYEGTYGLQAGGRTLDLRVFADGGELKVEPAGQGVTGLLARGTHEFVLAADPAIRLVFDVTDGRATRVTLYQGGGVFQGSRKQQ